MSIKGKYPESTPLYIALLSAGAAAAVAVFILVYNALGGGEGAGFPSVPDLRIP